MSALIGRYHRYQRFWSDFSLPRIKLVCFRIAFFALFALDGFLQIEHAPRYGTGFNVPHLAVMELLPGPSRAGMLVIFLLLFHVGALIAAGVAVRALMPVAAGLYGYAYFISQLDSYQHHYLMFLLVLISCFISWPWGSDESPQGNDGDKDGSKDNSRSGGSGARAGRAAGDGGRIGGPAGRLLLVQMSIVYLWAAVAKLDAAWLDGSTLTQQVRAGWVRELIDAIGVAAAAKLVLATELFLAVALLIPRLWVPALIAGVGFHIGVELTGFEIGLFSYFMLAFYILLIPDRAMERLAARNRRLALSGRMSGMMDRVPLLVSLLALGAGTVLLTRLPFAEVGIYAALALACAAVAMAAEILARRHIRATRAARPALARVAAAHLGACAALVLLAGHTEAVHGYYKFWAGSARRLGDQAGARQAYESLTRVSPEYGPGHYHLANMLRREDRVDEALRGYERAQAAAPGDYRAYLAAAELHDRAGRGAEALAAAARALAAGRLSPRDRQRAAAIQQRWAGR